MCWETLQERLLDCGLPQNQSTVHPVMVAYELTTGFWLYTAELTRQADYNACVAQ